ncbi:hypothetical protein ERY430_41402 [Erythrobacter sp. EC-HK427]|nr:hypothetical protein ERY430_41402 [Erythrobacter sp. EC-HK427]
MRGDCAESCKDPPAARPLLTRNDTAVTNPQDCVRHTKIDPDAEGTRAPGRGSFTSSSEETGYCGA